jgi:hypothetical protein
MWITPNYQNTDFVWPLSIDDKITIFEDRTMGWQLGLANRIINGESGANAIPHSGYAVLNIVLSYFEMIAKFRDGYDQQGESQHYFKQGVYEVFSQLRTHPRGAVERLLDVLYHGGRCGLYHGGMTDSRIVLTGQLDAAMAFDEGNERLVINPHRLIPGLIAHFQRYIGELRDTANEPLRSNFERRFDYEGR